MYAGIPIWYVSLVLPVLVGIVALFASDKHGRAISWLSALTLIIPMIATAYYWAVNAVSNGVVDPWVLHLEKYGLGTFYLFMDGLSAPVVVGVSLVTAFVAVYAYKYMATRIEEMRGEGENPPGLGRFFFLYNIFAIAMLGMGLSSNLLEFYFFLEISLISSFLLIAYYGYGDRKKIALLYFIWAHIAGALFIAGSLVYGHHAHSLDVVRIVSGKVTYVSPADELLGSAARIVAGVMLLGLFIKMAVLGVHMWLPYAHAEAPTPVSALLSPNLIGLAGYAIVRFVLPLFPAELKSIHGYLILLAVSTIIYGGLVALRQTDFKRFLAYSSVSQMGYLLLGIATLTAYGIGGAILHYLTHAIGKAVLFMVAGIFITEEHGLRDMTRMGGLAKYYPFTAAAALLGFMHLVGMPPTLGMWSELLITIGVVKAYPAVNAGNVVLVATMLLLAYGVSAGYAFITMRKVFYGRPREGYKHEVLDGFKTTVVILAVLGVLLFLGIAPLMAPLKTASQQIISLLG